MSDRFEIVTEPDKRLGFLFMWKPCIKVIVWERGWQGEGRLAPRLVGIENTRHVDMDEARALAAKMISDWETMHTRTTL